MWHIGSRHKITTHIWNSLRQSDKALIAIFIYKPSIWIHNSTTKSRWPVAHDWPTVGAKYYSSWSPKRTISVYLRLINIQIYQIYDQKLYNLIINSRATIEYTEIYVKTFAGNSSDMSVVVSKCFFFHFTLF